MTFKKDDKIVALVTYSGWFKEGDILTVALASASYVTIYHNLHGFGSFIPAHFKKFEEEYKDGLDNWI